MSLRIKDVLVKETGAKRMFPGQRHSLDTTERPSIDYGRDDATWEQSGETDAQKGYRSLKERCKQLKLQRPFCRSTLKRRQGSNRS